jgi:hypothetical protein
VISQTVATRFLPRKSCPIRWFRDSGAAPRREPRVAGGNGVGGGRRGGCSRAGGTIRMFPRLTQRRPAAGDCSIGANFRRRFARLFGSRCPATRVPLCDRGEAAIGSRGCGGTRIEAQQLPIESGLGATRCVAHIRERARLHRGATRRPSHGGAWRSRRARRYAPGPEVRRACVGIACVAASLQHAKQQFMHGYRAMAASATTHRVAPYHQDAWGQCPSGSELFHL